MKENLHDGESILCVEQHGALIRTGAKAISTVTNILSAPAACSLGWQ